MAIPGSDPIVVAPTPTPFRPDDSIDFDAAERNVERWMKTPLSGFVLGTANGEELSLSEEEKAQTIRVTKDACDGQRLVIGGVDCPSVTESLRRAERFASAGADLVRIRVPKGMASLAVESYFAQVTARAPVPIVVIHQTFDGVPAASPNVLGGLVGLDNVFGYITDHDVRFEAAVRLHAPRDRRFWICNGGLLLFGALMGANGACMWLGNIMPSLCMDIMRLGIEQRFQDARPMQDMATALDSSIALHGVAGVKAALGMLGFEGMRTRAPTPELSQAGRQQVRAALLEAKLPVSL